MKIPLVKMLGISLIVTILSMIVSVALFARKSAAPKPGFDYKKMETMSYIDAMQYQKENIETVSGFQAEWEIWRIPGQLWLTLKFGLLHFISIFLGCYIFWRWSAMQPNR